MLHLHRWGKWAPLEHYVDSSWGGNARSTMLVRTCIRCGLVKPKGLYGVVLPIPGACVACGESADDGPTASNGEQWCGECYRDAEAAQ